MVVNLLLLFASAVASSQPQTESKPPVELSVTENAGKLSYSLANRTPWRITNYQVVTDFPSTHLSCFIVAEVKKPEDLEPRDVCSILFDAKGKPVARTSRIGFVRFDNGTTWKPGETK